MSKEVNLSKLKKNDYFRFIGKSKVYVYNGRSGGKYTYSDSEDISSSYQTKTDRIIEIGFTH